MRRQVVVWRVTLVLDVAMILVVASAPTELTVVLIAPLLPSSLVTICGIWTGVVSVLAIPAVVVLHMSPPRLPLSQRSALVASAAWFIRAVGAGIVFALSIVLGAVAGVVASRVSDAQPNLGSALGLAFADTAQVVLWPILAVVVGVAYLIMAIRWLVDLGWIVEAGGGTAAWKQLTERWGFTPGPRGEFWVYLFVALIGRIALFLTLVTVAVAVWIATSQVFHS